MRKPAEPVGPSAWAVALLWAASAFTVAAAILLSGDFSPFW
ncbi:hypothetical protein [Phenylobacterium sp.]|jgi:hypothetical protein